MNKILSFFASILASAFLCSCEQDNYFIEAKAPQSSSKTILFKTGNTSSQTRSGTSITSLDRFTVSAINTDNTVFFNNEVFTFDNSSNAFTSSTPYYWPESAGLSFYAISDAGEYSVAANNVPQYTYSNWNGETDLVAATAIAGQKQIPYPLSFKHLTSQIYVAAEAENKTEELTYKLISIKMTAPSTGIYNFANTTGGIGTWQIDNTKTSEYTYDTALPMSFMQNGQADLSSYYWNILPNTDGELYFRIEYQILQNDNVIADYTGSKSKVCTIKNTGLVAGKKYRYNLILSRSSEDALKFTNTVNDWADDNNSNNTPSTPTTSDINSNGHEYIDLGLPSGTLWATTNVGETSPTASPNTRFKWGETFASSNEFVSTYKYNSFSGGYTKYYLSTSNTLELDDDAAHVLMGGDWHMPDYSDIQELLSNTTLSINGSEYTYTSKTDPTKKLVVACYNSSGTNCLFWSRTLASDLSAYYLSDATEANGNATSKERYYPLPIRGVISRK